MTGLVKGGTVKGPQPLTTLLLTVTQIIVFPADSVLDVVSAVDDS